MIANLLKRRLVSYGAGLGLCKVFALIGLLLFAPSGGADAGERLRILAFGDSLTQGFGLREDEGFVPRLQGWLTARGIAAEVINGGVSGDTTAGGAARIGWSLTADVDAMILALGGNDMLRGLPPEAAMANLGQIIAAAKVADVPLLLVGMRAPMNYGAGYREAFEAGYAALAAEHGLLFEPRFLGGLGETPEEALPLMQADGVHPNAEGVMRIVAALGPRVAELAELAGR